MVRTGRRSTFALPVVTGHEVHDHLNLRPPDVGPACSSVPDTPLMWAQSLKALDHERIVPQRPEMDMQNTGEGPRHVAESMRDGVRRIGRNVREYFHHRHRDPRR